MTLVHPLRVVRARALPVHGRSRTKLTGIHGEAGSTSGQRTRTDDGNLGQDSLLHDAMLPPNHLHRRHHILAVLTLLYLLASALQLRLLHDLAMFRRVRAPVELLPHVPVQS